MAAASGPGAGRVGGVGPAGGDRQDAHGRQVIAMALGDNTPEAARHIAQAFARARAEELERQIAQVCVRCPRMRQRDFTCDRSRGGCTSKRVKRWLRELEAVEKGGQR